MLIRNAATLRRPIVTFSSTPPPAIEAPRERDYIHIAVASPGRVSVDVIKAAVCQVFEIPLGAMTCQRRSYRFAHPRQVAMALASELTDCSLPMVGRLFGDRDHTTVIHAKKAVALRIAANNEFRDRVKAVREEVGRMVDQDGGLGD